MAGEIHSGGVPHALLKKINEVCQEKMKKVVRALAETSLEYAKLELPPATPTMKVNILQSGFTKETGDEKWEFGFTHKDADALEEGLPFEPFSGTYTQNVKRHLRKTKTGNNVPVKKHRRQYKNHRPGMIDGKWFMLKGHPKIKGTGWLEKSANKIFKDEKVVADEIKFQFKR